MVTEVSHYYPGMKTLQGTGWVPEAGMWLSRGNHH